jgi:hypothetical protein
MLDFVGDLAGVHLLARSFDDATVLGFRARVLAGKPQRGRLDLTPHLLPSHSPRSYPLARRIGCSWHASPTLHTVQRNAFR